MARIVKRENELVAKFFDRFDQMFTSRQYFVTHHQDVRKSGYPDKGIHGYGRSSHWEFKHATPNFSTNQLQELTCMRLAAHSFCRYVIFVEDRDHLNSIRVVHPEIVFKRQGKTGAMHAERMFPGFDFDALAGHIHSIHTHHLLSIA